MNKKKVEKKNNVVNFPSKLTPIEKEIEAIIFAAAEPLDIDTIESMYIWINKNIFGGKSFYTSLGHVDDFQNEVFIKILILSFPARPVLFILYLFYNHKKSIVVKPKILCTAELIISL